MPGHADWVQLVHRFATWVAFSPARGVFVTAAVSDLRHESVRVWRPSVLVVIPARDEEAMLPAALGSAQAQDYDGEIEIIVADGSDTSAMAEAVAASFPKVRVIPNPQRNAASGLNCALRVATHPVVVRCDARCVLPANYVRRAVATLARTAAATVGGRQCPVGATVFEQAVGLAMTTPLGAGDARYRIGGAEGPADTVFLGVFRREALEKVGGFDATLERNQDYELNWRLRQCGETVWFDPALNVSYRPRGSFAELTRQYFDYGYWKRVVLRHHPSSLRWRQLAAPLLVLALAGSGLLAAAAMLAPPDACAVVLGIAAIMPLSYLSLLVGGAVLVGTRRRSPAAVLMPPVLVTMHLAWGLGFFYALARPRADR